MKKFYFILLIAFTFNLAGQNQFEYYGFALDSASLPPHEVKHLDFTALGDDKPASFSGRGYFYLHFTVSDSLLQTCDFLTIPYALIDLITFYGEQDGLVMELKTTGQEKKFTTRLKSLPDFNFKLDDDINDYYLKVKGSRPLVLPLRLNSREELNRSSQNNFIIFGAFAGIVLVMVLYNLMLFILTQDKSYLFYVIYLAFLGLTQAAIFGFTDKYMFPEIPYINIRLVTVSGAIVGVSSLLFIVNFLHLKERERIFYWILLSVAALDIVAIVILFIGELGFAYNLVNLIALVGSILAFIVAFKLVMKGYRPARFFLTAWSVFLLSVIIYSLKDFGIVPYSAIVRRSMLIGSTLEIILLSVALADRITVLRKEKEASQERALAMSRENERIIREQNVELERRVDARTMELQEANEELQVAMQNLKDTQTQLVDAEKMASLGQLTAGIAHEINNPINFITSNIKPLRMDLEEVYQIVDGFKELEDSQAGQDLKKALDRLQEFDYDFLKDEINELVDGISDGAQRTSEIVRGLRTFSRLDEDVVKPANINEGLDSTLVLLRNKTKDKVKIVRDYGKDVPEIDCFPGKLNQAFMNILNNGIYAVFHKEHPQGEQPTLTLKTRVKAANEISIHLIDNGMGMDEDTKRKIFDPFFTTKEVGEGTGLGMSIVFKVIDKHGGDLEVKSEPGVGTEFMITLPIKQPSEFS